MIELLQNSLNGLSSGCCYAASIYYGVCKAEGRIPSLGGFLYALAAGVESGAVEKDGFVRNASTFATLIGCEQYECMHAAAVPVHGATFVVGHYTAGDISHFVLLDSDTLAVLYDPLGDSQVVARGRLKDTRVFSIAS